jgi:hypothetical protein
MGLTFKQKGELWARDFLGNDTWVRWKRDMDELLAYRKTIKGKPDEGQRYVLEQNDFAIKIYKKLLYSGATE